MSYRLTLIAIILSLAAGISATAAPPQTLSHQGRLLSSTGEPYSGVVSFQFAIYDTAEGGVALWTETHDNVTVNDGYYSVLLGSITPIDRGIWTQVGGPRYLGITVGGDSEIMPRTELSSTPYAQVAASVVGFDPGPNNTSLGTYNFVAGDSNIVDGHYLVVGGGKGNEAYGDVNAPVDSTIDEAPPAFVGDLGTDGTALLGPNQTGYGATIGGGFFNTAAGVYSTIAGGGANSANGTASAIGGGLANRAYHYATASGGVHNYANGLGSSAGGGVFNLAEGRFSTVAGGGWAVWGNSTTANRAYDDYAFIGGGADNQIGINNSDPAENPFSVIGGGRSNLLRGDYSFIGGGKDNDNQASYSVIAGGEDNFTLNTHSTVGGGLSNTADDYFATVAGGDSSTATAQWATVGGGHQNQAIEEYTAIPGGRANIASGHASAIGGGRENLASDWAAVVSGGQYNQSNGYYSTVGGGVTNHADGDSSVVAGGADNVASGSSGAIGGGTGNTAGPGANATVPGGTGNEAIGDNSFAGGFYAQARENCSFVWNDCCSQAASSKYFASIYPNSFNVRATGGIYFMSSCDSLNAGGAGTGVYLPPNESQWIQLSDRNQKRNIRHVDEQQILDKISRLPISRWSYKDQDLDVEHIGPMAQDFYASFGLGTDNRHIASLDPAGVALAAIKALNEKTEQLENSQTRISDLEAQVQELRAIVEQLVDRDK